MKRYRAAAERLFYAEGVLAGSVETRGGGALSVFDVPADQATDPALRGCAAINAHRVAAAHEEHLAVCLRALTGGDGERAQELQLLVDGALVTSAARSRRDRPRADGGRAQIAECGT